MSPQDEGKGLGLVAAVKPLDGGGAPLGEERNRNNPPFLMLNRAADATTKTHIQEKLDKCTTYNDFEMIDSLVCQKQTLYPGDVLFLPKRVDHSARATSGGLSAHLTLGFADNMCLFCGQYVPQTSGKTGRQHVI